MTDTFAWKRIYAKSDNKVQKECYHTTQHNSVCFEWVHLDGKASLCWRFSFAVHVAYITKSSPGER